MNSGEKFTEPVWIYPFDVMKVGDSFFVPTAKPADQHYVIDCMAKEARVKVRAYTTMHEGFLGVRVWRIA